MYATARIRATRCGINYSSSHVLTVDIENYLITAIKRLYMLRSCLAAQLIALLFLACATGYLPNDIAPPTPISYLDHETPPE